MRDLKLFEIFLSLVILFGFSSCNKKNSSSGSSSAGLVGEAPNFAYGETFQEVELTVSEFLGDFVLNIETVTNPGDETTDSFEFYICSKDGTSCLPTEEEPKFVDSLYQGYGYDYPLAREGENDVFVRACDSSLSGRVCGEWQSSSYTQESPTDEELSEWLDMSYQINEVLGEVVDVVEEEAETSFDDLEEDVDVTEVVLDEVLENIEEEGEEVDLESLADVVVEENTEAEGDSSDDESNDDESNDDDASDDDASDDDASDDDASDDDASDDDASDDDTNDDDTNDDDTNDDDANDDDTNADEEEEGFFEGDGFNFDTQFDEEEIAVVVGSSALAIVAIPVIVHVVKQNQKRKASAKKKLKGSLDIGKPELFTKENSQKVADKLLKKEKLEILAQERTALLIKAKDPSLSAADKKKIEEDLKLSRQAIKERLAVELSWEATGDRIAKLKDIVELSEGGGRGKRIFQSRLKKYLRTVLSEIEVLDKEIKQRTGTDPKGLDQKATLEEMRADRALERDNILKLAAGQKVDGLKVRDMANLRGKALRVEVARIASGSGRLDLKPQYRTLFSKYFKELNELLGLVQDKRLFDGDFFEKAYKKSITAAELNKSTELDLGFKRLVNFDDIKLSDVRRLGADYGKTSITKKGFNVKFGLSSEGNENLATYLKKNAAGIKKLLELKESLELAIALKELEALEKQ